MLTVFQLATLAGRLAFEKSASKFDKLLALGKISPEGIARHVSHILPSHSQDIRDTVVNEVRGVMAAGGNEVKSVTRMLRGQLKNLNTAQYNHRTGYLSPDNWDTARLAGSPSVTSRPKLEQMDFSTLPSFISGIPGGQGNASMKKLQPNLYSADFPAAYAPAFSPESNAIVNTKPGRMDSAFRHELGHWSSFAQAGDPAARKQFENKMRLMLGRLRHSDPAAFTSEIAQNPFNRLFEASGHYLGSKAGLGGARLRADTQRNWNSPWADKLRRQYPNDPGLASVVEHLQRHYKMPGGNLITQPGL